VSGYGGGGRGDAGGRDGDRGQGYGRQRYRGQGYDERDYQGEDYAGRGYGQQGGYGAQGGYDDQGGYGDQGYGGRGAGRRQAGGPPSWGDPEGQPGQAPRPRGGAGQRRARGQGAGDAGRGSGQPQGGRDQGRDPQGAGPDPWAQGPRQPGAAPRYRRGRQQPGRRGDDAEPAWPGGAQQQAYGADPRAPRQPPGGYDPRGAVPRRASEPYPGDSYPGDDHQGWGGDSRRDSAFLPGFGQGDDYDQGGPRDGRYPGDYEDSDRPVRRGRRDRGGGRGGGGDWDDGGERPKRRGTVRRLAPWIALVVILTPILIGGLYVYHLYENKYHPADYAGPGTGSVTVQVNSGDTAFSLGPRLQQLGVVASARAFELAAEHSTNSAGLEAGFYKLHSHMQASLAYAYLLNPKDRVQLMVTIPEGKRASQVVAILAKETSIPAANFQKVINNPAQLGLPSYANGKVEGYLFPATYTIQPNETALQILQAMVQRFNVEAQQINISSAAHGVGLSSEQLITEASMVQAEGGVVSDYPKIARVIINRLHIGMKLQFDSVLLYGLNAYAINVTQAQIDTPGPYNDFQHAGLPPGPICNPGNSAIQAVLHPQPGDWLYFLTKTGGASEFSATPLPGQ